MEFTISMAALAIVLALAGVGRRISDAAELIADALRRQEPK